MSLSFDSKGDSVVFEVRLKPRSSRNEVLGVRDGVLHCSVTSPPVKGKANKALIELLADYFGFPKKAFEFTAGASSRNKRICILSPYSNRVKK
ncbi:MAG: DUF167 domain-containing protein [Planctomycetota bacterium]|nr:DUF167 domain-containing protein [Planctomycetota bacterium]